jgi:ubiquinone/menaquinone biosynthesis C-methylase UbiE
MPPVLIILLCVMPGLLRAQYEMRPGDPAGIGKWYMGREIAHTMCAAHAEWLDRSEREREERPLRMLERMRIAPADRIADIGCGTGYHSLLMAARAPQGMVYAVDIQAAMLDSVFLRSQRAGLSNVDVVLGSTTDTRLPEGRLDKVLLVDVYHEFDHPVEMMASIVRAMRPGALLFLVEFRREDPWIPIKDVHRMNKEQCVREMAAAGLEWERSWNGLPWQHFLVFRKPGG